jgi:hypothetical protein
MESEIIFNRDLILFLRSDQIKNNKMGGACGTHGGEEVRTGFW